MNTPSKTIVSQIPELARRDFKSLEFKRLGGLTNKVFRVQAEDQRFLLRIPGEGTEDYIDRRVEAHNARAAANAGVSANVLYFDSDSGLMLAEYIENCETMTAEGFRHHKDAAAEAGRLFSRLHNSGETFQFRFELFSMIDGYLTTLKKLNTELPDGYHKVVREAEPVREKLNQCPAPLAPCHCDPLAENFLYDGKNMWLVDWEYSGMNDPLWDLGDLSVEAGFNEEQDQQMLLAYCGGEITADKQGRMVIYKAMCDLLWTLWGLIQHANDNPSEDFWAYSINRFERCQQLMGREMFARHLDAIA